MDVSTASLSGATASASSSAESPEPSTSSASASSMRRAAEDDREKSSSRFDDEEEEEEDVCRICRNPGDAENPLRYPCACSGSIKFVHQDCLLQWLNHSNARQCEVLIFSPFSLSLFGYLMI